MTITVELPEDIAAHLASRGEDIPRAVLEAFALNEYVAGHLTHAQLQRVLRLENRMEADAFLKAHGVELEYTEHDLERDRETHRKLGL